MTRMSLSTIADMAGVSKPVVYTVLKHRENKGIRVSPQTKEKILKIARESGYVAPKSARELFSGRSDNIGIVFHKIVPPFSELVSHLQQEAHRKNLEITPYITNMDADLEEHYLNSVRDGRVDAVIAIAIIDGSVERYQRFVKTPYNLKILYYGEPFIPGVPGIHFDETEAGRLAAEHLTQIGCKRLAFFGGTENSVRAKGFVRYLKNRNFPDPLIFNAKGGINFFQETKVLAREFLKFKNLPDGVFASNDLWGISLLSEFARKGVKVPRDIKIMGCNNTEICLYTTPTLTSIDIKIPVLAKKAIERIGRMIEEKPLKPFHTRVPVSLVVRESTKV